MLSFCEIYATFTLSLKNTCFLCKITISLNKCGVNCTLTPEHCAS